MTSGGGTHGDRPGGGDDFDLEIIELEPATPTARVGTPAGRRPSGDRQRRRGPLIIAILVVVALVASVVVSRSKSSSRDRASTTTTRLDRVRVPFPGILLFPFRVGAQVLTGGANGLQVTDTDTGKVTYPRVRNLPAGSMAIAAHSGTTVAVRVSGRLYWFTMRELIAHKVDATTAFPAVQHGFLWLATTSTATMVPGPNTSVATRGIAVGATRAGLVVTDAGAVILQRARAAPTPLLPAPATVLGVHPDRVAWTTNDCGILRCPVHVTEIASGASSSWLQLTGHPSPLVVAGASATFSPDGNYLAITVPDNSVTTPENLIVADLRTRAATSVYVRGSFEQPARPGSDDATGLTLDWTPDTRYLLLAPAGIGRVMAIDPAQPHVVSSRASWGTTTTAAVIGASSAGALDFPRHDPNRPIDTGGPTEFGAPGLTLAAADDSQFDVVDITTGRVSSWPVEGRSASEAGPHPIARVDDGWLVVRFAGEDAVVDLFPTGGGREIQLGDGAEVFASPDGSRGWISNPQASSVQSYDAKTHVLSGPLIVPGIPVAAIGDRLVVAVFGSENIQLDTIDPLGSVQEGATIESTSVEVLASGGERLVYRDAGGLYVFDFTSRTSRLITANQVFTVSMSPNGENLAWLYGRRGLPTGGVAAMRLSGSSVASVSADADRVLVADDGTVVFTNDADVWRGRVDQNGASRVYGLAPTTDAVLGLG